MELKNKDWHILVFFKIRKDNLKLTFLVKMPFIHYRTKAFIFKKVDRFEADRIFTVFTQDFGKLEILARAIRKITSKLRQASEIFYLSEIEFIQGRTYKTLTDAVLIKKFENINKYPEKLKTAFKISETLDDFLKFEERDEKIWKLILGTFQKLNNHLTSSFLELFFYFLWNFFSTLGYKPELSCCLLCQKRLSLKKDFLKKYREKTKIYFSPREGGIICQPCAFRKNKKEIVEINPEIIKILEIILRKDWQGYFQIKINPFLRKQLRDISKNYYSYLLQEYY